MSKQIIPCIIDCDPGVDDAIALLYALNHPNLDVKAITTVYGNVGLDKTSVNAQLVVGLAQKDTPVFSGARKPLVNQIASAAKVHGEDGFGDFYQSYKHLTSNNDIKDNAVLKMKEIIENSNEPVVLFPLGPMTNIAILLVTFPELKEKIKAISFMGGGFYYGNRTPSAEFNFYCDPHAAQIVLQSGVKLIMSGLDITDQAIITEKELDKFKKIPNKASEVMHKILSKYQSVDQSLHDPVTIMTVTDPELFEFESFHVVVETSGEYSVGKTIADVRKNAPLENRHCVVATKLDHNGFIEKIVNSLSQYKDGGKHE